MWRLSNVRAGSIIFEKENNKIFILLYCFVIMEALINNILITILPVNNILGFTLLAVCLYIVVMKKIKISYKIPIIILVLIALFFLSMVQRVHGDLITYFIQFLSFGFAGFLCGSIDVNPNKIFRYGTIILLINVLIFTFTSYTIKDKDAFDFGYMMTPGVICSLYYSLFLFKKKRRLMGVLCSLLTLYAFILTVSHCGRGTLLAIGVFIMCYALFINTNRVIKILSFVLVIIAAIVAANFERLILMAYDILNSFNISIWVIDKSVYLIRINSFMHGRSELYSAVFDNLSPLEFLFGRGIAVYEQTNGTYTHNVFLSAFSDFGLFGVIILCVILYQFFRIFLKAENDLRKLYLILFCCGIVKLMVSSIYWKTSIFWCILAIILKNSKRNYNITFNQFHHV